MDFQLTPITGIDQSGMARFGSDDHLFVFFAEKPIHNKTKSREAGIPIYDTVEVVHIQQPGERDYIERPAEEADRRRFQRQYQAYKEGRDQIPEGTPVDLLFPHHPGIPQTLKHLKIFTIQQLARLTEEGISKVGMGARDWVESAKQYLARGSDGKDFHHLKGQIDDLKGQLEVRDRQISELRSMIEGLQAERQRATGQHTMPPMVHLPAAGTNVLAAVEQPVATAPEPEIEAPDLRAFLSEDSGPEPVKRGPGRPRKN